MAAPLDYFSGVSIHFFGSSRIVLSGRSGGSRYDCIQIGDEGMLAVRTRALALSAAAAVAALLGGCATEIGPSASELKARWDAENVYPQAYRQDLLAFLRTYLNDPSHVRGASVSQPQLKYVGPGDRYVTCVRFNARNSDGKYLGSKDGAAIYVSGKLDRFLDVAKDVRELCKEVAYAPFPELEKLTR
jgi:hypothetical protein